MVGGFFFFFFILLLHLRTQVSSDEIAESFAKY